MTDVILICYIVGTVCGLYFGFKKGALMGAHSATQLLIDQGFIRVEIKDGEIFLLPYDHDDSEESE